MCKIYKATYSAYGHEANIYISRHCKDANEHGQEPTCDNNPDEWKVYQEWVEGKCAPCEPGMEWVKERDELSRAIGILQEPRGVIQWVSW